MDPLHTVMGCVIRRFSVSDIAILGGRLGEPGAERERVPDQVRSIRARVNPRRPNGLVTRDHDASSQPAEAWMYYSPVTKSITTNVQRWRIYTEQRSLNLWMGVLYATFQSRVVVHKERYLIGPKAR